MDSGAVLFVGPVGTGKSTTAAVFHSRGYAVLSDDVCSVRISDGRCVLQPGRPRLRLCEDAAAAFSHLDPKAKFLLDKTDFGLDREEMTSLPTIRRIYLLEDGGDPQIEPVPPMQAAVALGKECFVRLSHSGPDVLAAHLRKCTTIASLALTCKLIRPRDLRRSHEMVDIVERDLNSGGTSGPLEAAPRVPTARL